MMKNRGSFPSPSLLFNMVDTLGLPSFLHAHSGLSVPLTLSLDLSFLQKGSSTRNPHGHLEVVF
jgi:hypothetical protein